MACKARDGHTLALMLQDNHYYTLLHKPDDDTFPTFWLTESPGIFRALDGGAKALSSRGRSVSPSPARSVATLSVHSLPSGGGLATGLCSAPATLQLSVDGAPTPSVHTCVASSGLVLAAPPALSRSSVVQVARRLRSKTPSFAGPCLCPSVSACSHSQCPHLAVFFVGLGGVGLSLPDPDLDPIDAEIPFQDKDAMNARQLAQLLNSGPEPRIWTCPICDTRIAG